MAEPSHEPLPAELKRLAHWAGAAYLASGVPTLFGYFHAPLAESGVTVLTRTLTGSAFRFRIGVICDLLATAFGVLTAVLLYELLKRVNRRQALLMAILLLVSIPIAFVLALNYVAAQMLLSGSPELAAFTDAQRNALGMLFLRLLAHSVLAAEIFWGLWLLPFGLLVMRSGFLPRVLGVLLIIAGVAYVAHSLVTILLAGQRLPVYEQLTWLARGAGEFPIMLWLLIKGADVRRMTQTTP